jgi:hypothetical protein
VLALYEDDPFLTRLLLEAGRYVVFGNIMCMHARYDETDRSTWPTAGRLKQSMLQFGVSSPRRVDALVARLVDSGFLEMVPAKQDRRVRILTPTERMYAQDMDWLAAHYLPLHVLFPDSGYAPMVQRDRSFPWPSDWSRRISSAAAPISWRAIPASTAISGRGSMTNKKACRPG